MTKKRSGYRQSEYRERDIGSCATHWSFSQQAEAQAAAGEQWARQGREMSVFQCHWCRRWRVGFARTQVAAR